MKCGGQAESGIKKLIFFKNENVSQNEIRHTWVGLFSHSLHILSVEDARRTNTNPDVHFNAGFEDKILSRKYEMTTKTMTTHHGVAWRSSLICGHMKNSSVFGWKVEENLRSLC